MLPLYVINEIYAIYYDASHSILGRLSFGWLGDRFNKKWGTAMALVFVGMGLLSFGFVNVDRLSLLIIALILVSIGYVEVFQCYQL